MGVPSLQSLHEDFDPHPRVAPPLDLPGDFHQARLPVPQGHKRLRPQLEVMSARVAPVLKELVVRMAGGQVGLVLWRMGGNIRDMEGSPIPKIIWKK